jgi:hypothetical protein
MQSLGESDPEASYGVRSSRSSTAHSVPSPPTAADEESDCAGPGLNDPTCSNPRQLRVSLLGLVGARAVGRREGRTLSAHDLAHGGATRNAVYGAGEVQRLLDGPQLVVTVG